MNLEGVNTLVELDEIQSALFQQFARVYEREFLCVKKRELEPLLDMIATPGVFRTTIKSHMASVFHVMEYPLVARVVGLSLERFRLAGRGGLAELIVSGLGEEYEAHKARVLQLSVQAPPEYPEKKLS